MRKLRHKERWPGQICSLIQLQAPSSCFCSLVQAKERTMLFGVRHAQPKLPLVGSSATKTAISSVLLIFSEGYGLKGWVKSFLKSTECIKKGKKNKIWDIKISSQVRNRANASTSAEKGQSTILLKDSLVMIFNNFKEKWKVRCFHLVHGFILQQRYEHRNAQGSLDLPAELWLRG